MFYIAHTIDLLCQSVRTASKRHQQDKHVFLGKVSSPASGYENDLGKAIRNHQGQAKMSRCCLCEAPRSTSILRRQARSSVMNHLTPS